MAGSQRTNLDKGAKSNAAPVKAEALTPKKKAVAAVAVFAIVVSLGLITYMSGLFGPGPAYFPPTDSIKFFGSIARDWENMKDKVQYVNVDHSEDGKSIRFFGKVPTQQVLDQMKSVIEKGEPKIDVKMEVTVGR